MNRPKISRRIVRNPSRPRESCVSAAVATTSNIVLLPSASALELDPRERLRVDHARDGPDLVDDELAEGVEILRLDLRDQVVLPEERMELHDALDAQELGVDL